MASYKRNPAREVAKAETPTQIWIDHAFIDESDLEWLAPVRQLTLWNVTTPLGFLAKLPHLDWLDLRGGTGVDLERMRGAHKIEYLQVMHVRGMLDLSLAAELPNLAYLELYGLPKVKELPSFKHCTKLERVEMGRLGGLDSFAGILDAPNLRELLLLNGSKVSPDDLERLKSHPKLEAFSWVDETVSEARYGPVIKALNKPSASLQGAPQWFDERAAKRTD
ncbi:MAG: hypothetical protein JST35_07615 [Armatimonadetes bacterium]|nr:hypothetical protein [Armatimonadota bacterium]